MKTQQNSIGFYKLLAKKLKREKSITHVEALNQVALQHGFSNWIDCQRQTTNSGVTPTTEPMQISFTEWLTKQKNRDTPLGDLSKDILRDKNWPLFEDLEGYENHLDRMGASWMAIDALKRAWKSYQRYIKNKYK